MRIEPRLDIIGAALADPSRMRILCALMDGRAFTNKELACAAEITPQTASAHLKQLESTGLTASLRSGRHIYHRIASAEVADMLERLAQLSPSPHLDKPGKAAADTRYARSCYNHLAGRLGVLITERLLVTDVVVQADQELRPGARYGAFVVGLDHDMPVRPTGHPVAKLCLDWTERKHHIAGPLGTAILDKALAEGWLARRVGDRALTVTPQGTSALEKWLGISDAQAYITGAR